jgi:hypothetical protein
MTTLLLCGYRNSEQTDQALGLEIVEGMTLLDRRIAQLQAMGHNVVCVVAGQSAEAQLRSCRRMHQTELAYDDLAAPTLLSNIKFGLSTCPEHAVFVHPIEIPVPSADQFRRLKDGWLQFGLENKTHIVQFGASLEAPWHFGFPLLVTRTGNLVLRSLPSLMSLVDTRLKYLHLNVSQPSDLASETKPF